MISSNTKGCGPYGSGESVTRRQELLCAVVLGAFGGWLISTAPEWMRASSYEHWWGIATAIGTVGAVLVALALALKESRDRRVERARLGAIIEGIVESNRESRRLFG